MKTNIPVEVKNARRDSYGNSTSPKTP